MRSPVALGALLATLTAGVAHAALSGKQVDRISESAAVVRELHAVPDADVPQALWDKARCVIVIPSVKKAAFGVGGEYGAGLMSCRQGGDWSAPVFMKLEKGSLGFQIGGQSTDLVLVVQNDRGMQKMLGNKVTLGADASVAAGPVGRGAQASTDAQMQAEVLSYSRARGLFAGVDLSGGALRGDSNANNALYGHDIKPREVLGSSTTKAPPETKEFLEALRAHDSRRVN